MASKVPSKPGPMLRSGKELVEQSSQSKAVKERMNQCNSSMPWTSPSGAVERSPPGGRRRHDTPEHQNMEILEGLNYKESTIEMIFGDQLATAEYPNHSANPEPPPGGSSKTMVHAYHMDLK